MSLIASVNEIAERLPLPDALLRLGVQFLVGRTSRRLQSAATSSDKAFAAAMNDYPIAIHADAANEQHYELPPAFFELVLGRHRKYSCCLYDGIHTTLDLAELRALEQTALNAALADGQSVLELGCGWGSLSLFMAERYPNSTIVSVSNSKPQRLHIEHEARERGLTNLTVVTADMNGFIPDKRFDRIVSVEMFEHMSNWRKLLERARAWISPDGKLFIHVFTHATGSYRFDHGEKADWIAQHFFTGGIMPSHGLMRQFGDLFMVERDWQWNGVNYQRTALDWLAKFDAHRSEVETIFRGVYGNDTALWMRRWRLFFLATAGLFGYAGGVEWGVSQYRLRPAVADEATTRHTNDRTERTSG